MLAIFIILGVGADDIFVFMDAWRQTATMASTPDYASRMAHTYRRTALTVLNTSLTTAIAFFATAAAPIMPIASFGLFAATMILLNWLSCITLWPCIVMLWELHFCRASGCGCCFSCDLVCPATPCKLARTDGTCCADVDVPRPTAPTAKVPGIMMGAAEAKSVSPTAVALRDAKCRSAEGGGKGEGAEASSHEASTLACTERFFRDVYSPLLLWQVGECRALKPISLALVLGMGCLGGWLSAEALTLSTPDHAPIWFPTDHM